MTKRPSSKKVIKILASHGFYFKSQKGSLPIYNPQIHTNQSTDTPRWINI